MEINKDKVIKRKPTMIKEANPKKDFILFINKIIKLIKKE